MVRLRTALPPALLATLVPLGAALGGCGVPDRPPEAGLSVTEALSGDAAGHDRALEPRPFSFPADHAAHPRFRTEWWYVTGNLDAADGRRFGYQLTFFRNALAPPPEPGSGVGNSGSPTTGAGAAERRSAWATRQVWFAHFAVTDAAAGRFVSGERLVRGAAGLAGAELLADGRGLRLHVADWSAETAGDGGSAEGGPAAAGLLPLRLRAAETGGRGRTAVGLTLGPGKPPVLHGDRGLSHKGGAPGNASYYYSFTRLPTSGTLEVDGERLAVTGLSWMDREWSTSALDEDLVGWDWFALQLDDGRELMAYGLRLRPDADGARPADATPAPPFHPAFHPVSGGTLVAPDGGAEHLELADLEIRVLERWRSPATGIRYPARWRIAVPRAGIDLEIEPILADQELDVGLRYWEGAVDARGTSAGRPVTGRGYVELTGYGAPDPPGGPGAGDPPQPSVRGLVSNRPEEPWARSAVRTGSPISSHRSEEPTE